MEHSPFASLTIKRGTITNREKDCYLVLRKNGERIVVEATSAAEAVEKSGGSEIRKVINLAFAAEQILEKGVLGGSDETFETRITMEEEMEPEFQVADLLEEEEGEGFVEFDLLEFSKLAKLGAPETSKTWEPPVDMAAVQAASVAFPEIAEAMPEPVILKEEAPPEAAAAISVEEVSAMPPKQIEIIDAPVEHPLKPTDKQLTPEEVEALLKG